MLTEQFIVTKNMLNSRPAPHRVAINSRDQGPARHGWAKPRAAPRAVSRSSTCLPRTMRSTYSR